MLHHPRTILRASALSVGAWLLHGCASMSENECLIADWQALGYTDGSRGAPVSRFDRYRRDCAEYGVTPDLEAWRTGRAEGLELFCRADRAYELGRSGTPLPSVCPEDRRIALEDAWAQGQAWRTVSNNIRTLEREKAEVERALEQEESLPDDADREEREAARVRRRALLNELERLGHELNRARAELVRLGRDTLPAR